MCNILSLFHWKGHIGKHERCGYFPHVAFLQLCTYRRQIYDDWGRCHLHMRGFTPHTVGRVRIARYLSVSEAPRWWLDRAKVGDGRRQSSSKARQAVCRAPNYQTVSPFPTGGAFPTLWDTLPSYFNFLKSVIIQSQPATQALLYTLPLCCTVDSISPDPAPLPGAIFRYIGDDL